MYVCIHYTGRVSEPVRSTAYQATLAAAAATSEKDEEAV